MGEGILVLNAGSSSLKFALYEAGDGRLTRRLRGEVEGLPARPHLAARDEAGRTLAQAVIEVAGEPPYEAALGAVLGVLTRAVPGVAIRAAGHRVVHGGRDYAAPLRLDAGVIRRLEALIPLAPLHQPHNLAPIAALARLYPGLPQIACFDTAFHRTNERLAQLFALPRALIEEGVLRYGFHGLSYEFIAGRLRELDPAAAGGRVIVAHLGNGASLCALRAGVSVATTMGFTALDGLPMGTRTGALDAGVVLYLLAEKKLDAKGLERLLYKESGLLGLSGVSHDMRALLASDHPHAAEAVDYFCYRTAREIGSLAAALGGLDALVFTAGIGEHAAPIRARIVDRCAWAGAVLDPAANAANAPRIDASGSRLALHVIPTDEEAMIAAHSWGMLSITPEGRTKTASISD